MSYTLNHTEAKDRRKSALITFLISLLVFLGIYFYQFTKITEKPEEVTMMLINFGDNQNGAEFEEPANQEGSLASASETTVADPVQQVVETPVVQPQPEKKTTPQKVITGSNTKVTAAKAEKVTKPKATAASKPAPAKKSATKATNSNAATGAGDGRGNQAIGNLIRGRGTNSGTQGAAGTTGNAGDPLGGQGNGDSRIGVDRKLIGFIPGTMGRGGAQPAHSCSASGTITISYTVDKAGNVVSARRSGGLSDPCAVSTTVDWVKRYVKAEKANTSSTGSYRITF